MGRASHASASLLAAILLAVDPLVTSVAVVLAADSTPTLAVAAESGPPGLSVGVSGSGYQAGTAYDLCLLAADQTQCDPAASALGSFTADASGSVPAGTQVRVPGVVAGSYLVIATAPGSAGMVATAPFDVSAPTLSIDPQAGPAGLAVVVAGSGYAPSTAYSLCIVPSGTPQCGKAGIVLGDVTADASGNVPTGTSVRIPGQAQATYDLGVMLKGAAAANLFATVPFVEVGPTIALNPPSGPGGAVVTVTGAGLAPGGKYSFCLATAAASACAGTGADLGGFTADASGAVPDGATLTIPMGGPGDVTLGIRLAGGSALLLGSVSFSRTAGTPPPSSPPLESTAPQEPAASAAGAGASGNPGASGVAALIDLGPGGPVVWVLVGVALVAVVLGFVLSRRRRARS